MPTATNTLESVAQSRANVRIPAGQLFIAGQWCGAADGRTSPSVDPTTEAAITDVAVATAEDVEAAIKSARKAFDEGPWPRMSGYERGRILNRVAELMERDVDDLALRETLDMGMPLRFSREAEVPIATKFIAYYAGFADKIDGKTHRPSWPAFTYTLREPVGVVAAITPFNFPLILTCSKMGPALAAGNTVIHKPASATPLTAIKLAEIMAEAGVPDGVYNLLTGPGSQIGDALVTSPLIDKIAFTGSTEVGKGIARKAADTLKKVTFELGGKSANLFFADADMEHALQQTFFGIFYSKGEVCTAGSRLLVERSVHDEVVEGLTNLIRANRLGDPLDPDTFFGPLASAEQYKKVSGYVDIGRGEGATAVIGGKRPDRFDKGFFYEPTLMTDANNDMRIAQEEIFGPVLTVIPFDSEEDAIRMANGTEFGLAGGVQTHDAKRLHRVAAALKCGVVWGNTYNLFDPTTPFGGTKASGLGRELGPEGLDAYTQTKSVWVDLS